MVVKGECVSCFNMKTTDISKCSFKLGIVTQDKVKLFSWPNYLFFLQQLILAEVICNGTLEHLFEFAAKIELIEVSPYNYISCN